MPSLHTIESIGEQLPQAVEGASRLVSEALSGMRTESKSVDTRLFLSHPEIRTPTFDTARYFEYEKKFAADPIDFGSDSQYTGAWKDGSLKIDDEHAVTVMSRPMREFRARKELAAVRLHNLSSFETLVPLTGIRERRVDWTENWLLSQKQLVHERLGRNFFDWSVERPELFKPDISVKNPRVHNLLEQAYAEKSAFGDADAADRNVTLEFDKHGQPVVGIIDADYYFLQLEHGLFGPHDMHFNGQRISDSTLKKIADFSNALETSAARHLSSDSGLSVGQHDDILRRNAEMLSTKRFGTFFPEYPDEIKLSKEEDW